MRGVYFGREADSWNTRLREYSAAFQTEELLRRAVVRGRNKLFEVDLEVYCTSYVIWTDVHS